eukprot:9682141-Ditylum_brightwellii.AAC.1
MALGLVEGITLGSDEGFNDGRSDGIALGLDEGIELGFNVGVDDGLSDGITLGLLDRVGLAEGSHMGSFAFILLKKLGGIKGSISSVENVVGGFVGGS